MCASFVFLVLQFEHILFTCALACANLGGNSRGHIGLRFVCSFVVVKVHLRSQSAFHTQPKMRPGYCFFWFLALCVCVCVSVVVFLASCVLLSLDSNITPSFCCLFLFCLLDLTPLYRVGFVCVCCQPSRASGYWGFAS